MRRVEELGAKKIGSYLSVKGDVELALAEELESRS